eukprot:941405-Rhodomonas_salina.1
MVIFSFDLVSVMLPSVLAHKETVITSCVPNSRFGNGGVHIGQIKIDVVESKVIECVAKLVEQNQNAVVRVIVDWERIMKRTRGHNLLERTLVTQWREVDGN